MRDAEPRARRGVPRIVREKVRIGHGLNLKYFIHSGEDFPHILSNGVEVFVVVGLGNWKLSGSGKRRHAAGPGARSAGRGVSQHEPCRSRHFPDDIPSLHCLDIYCSIL